MFMFELTVSRAIRARASMHVMILKAIDFSHTLSILAAKSTTKRDLVDEYVTESDNFLEIIRYIAYGAFSDEVLILGFSHIHANTIKGSNKKRQKRAEALDAILREKKKVMLRNF